MKHVFEFVCCSAHISKPISGRGCFEVVHLAKQGIELFTRSGAVARGSGQVFECGPYLLKLVFKL